MVRVGKSADDFFWDRAGDVRDFFAFRAQRMMMVLGVVEFVVLHTVHMRDRVHEVKRQEGLDRPVNRYFIERRVGLLNIVNAKNTFVASQEIRDLPARFRDLVSGVLQGVHHPVRFHR